MPLLGEQATIQSNRKQSMDMHELEVEITSHFVTYKAAAEYVSKKLGVTQATALGWLNGDRTPAKKDIHALVQLIQDLEDEEANKTTAPRRRPRNRSQKPTASGNRLDEGIEPTRKSATPKRSKSVQARKGNFTRLWSALRNGMGYSKTKSLSIIANACPDADEEKVETWLPDRPRKIRKAPAGGNYEAVLSLLDRYSDVHPDAVTPPPVADPVTPSGSRGPDGSITITFEGKYADRVLEVLANIRR